MTFDGRWAASPLGESLSWTLAARVVEVEDEETHFLVLGSHLACRSSLSAVVSFEVASAGDQASWVGGLSTECAAQRRPQAALDADVA
jgi:hypothetical protein